MLSTTVMRNSQLSPELCYTSRREDEMEAEGKCARLIVEVEGQSWAECLLPIACVFQHTGRKAVVSEVPNEQVPFPRGRGDCWRRGFFFHCLASSFIISLSLFFSLALPLMEHKELSCHVFCSCSCCHLQHAQPWAYTLPPVSSSWHKLSLAF